MGVREDIEDRMELTKGSVDFLASNEYMNRPPMPPTFVFVLDVTKQAIDSQYLITAVHTIKSVIEGQAMVGQDRARVGFIAYDTAVHFFNLRATLR